MNRLLKTSAITLSITLLSALSGCLTSGGEQEAARTEPGPNPGPSNSAPTISGSPPSAITVGEAYVFRPSATDADSDPLTFSIQNLPSWAQFDSSNGEISGTPTLGNIGMYRNIAVSVSDGQASASTPQFSVEVTQIQLGSVTLSWTAPTQNSDGSTLTDLDAYKIYYGNSAGNYPNQITISNSSITTYVVENLAPATYFFVATSVNDQGVESEFSDPAQVSVN